MQVFRLAYIFSMSKKTLTFMTAIFFAILLVLAIFSAANIITPLQDTISQDKQLLAITINDDLKIHLIQNISENETSRNSFILVHLTAIFFSIYMIYVRIYNLLKKQVSKLALPIIALTNILLLSIAWIIGSVYLTPTFFTIAAPLLFFGILPFISGLNHL